MTKQPHASWANIYDKAYELSFGSLYHGLTEHTLAAIERVLGPNGSIVDFGAGTGRLTLPLLNRGYQVTAVEPCQEMADVLRKKGHGRSLDLCIAKMADFQPAATYDMALCVFTVIAYVVDRDELIKSLNVAYDSLKSTGLLLLEIPSIEMFRDHSSKSKDMARVVNVIKLSANEFQYVENIERLSDSGETETISDTFTIRFWPSEDVGEILTEIGFNVADEHEDSLARLGSDYFLLRKA